MIYIRNNQKASAHVLLLVVAMTLIVFIVFSASAGFKNKLFGSLFTKSTSFASGNAGSVIFVDESNNQITETTSATVKLQISDVVWPTSTPTTSNNTSDDLNLFNISSTTTCQRLPQVTNLKPAGVITSGNNTLTWDPVAGTTRGYFLVINDRTNPYAGCEIGITQNPGDVCAVVLTNSYSFNFQPTRLYRWGVVAANDCGISMPASVVVAVGPFPTPTPVTTATVLLAEDSNFSVNAQSASLGNANYNFSDPTPGIKSLYAKFIGSNGTVQNANPFPATISLISPTPIPTPSQTDSPTDFPTPTPTESPTPASSPTTDNTPVEIPQSTETPGATLTPGGFTLNNSALVLINERNISSAADSFAASQSTSNLNAEKKDCGFYCSLDSLLKKISPSTEERFNSFILSTLIKLGLIKE